jgi:hypothetical protein
MEESMKRFSVFLVSALTSGCTGSLTLGATAPPPPTVTVGVGVSADAPPPPASAGATVEVEPIASGDPEEVTATTEPPDPVYEEQTDSPGPGVVWVGGYWGWNGADWGWNWGRWAAPPEGQVYVDPYYERVGGRVVYVRGYWGPHDAPRRSYGGDRIRFTAAVRPANYHRGDHVVVEHRAGPLPGKRPGSAYEHATGAVRPLPKATVPAHRVAEVHDTAAPREKETEREGTTARAPGPGAAHETTREPEVAAGHETAHVSATEPRETQVKPQPEPKKAPPARAAPARAQPKKAEEKK